MMTMMRRDLVISNLLLLFRILGPGVCSKSYAKGFKRGHVWSAGFSIISHVERLAICSRNAKQVCKGRKWLIVS